MQKLFVIRQLQVFAKVSKIFWQGDIHILVGNVALLGAANLELRKVLR